MCRKCEACLIQIVSSTLQEADDLVGFFAFGDTGITYRAEQPNVIRLRWQVIPSASSTFSSLPPHFAEHRPLFGAHLERQASPAADCVCTWRPCRSGERRAVAPEQCRFRRTANRPSSEADRSNAVGPYVSNVARHGCHITAIPKRVTNDFAAMATHQVDPRTAGTPAFSLAVLNAKVVEAR